MLRNMAGKTDNLVACHEYILRQLQETGSIAINELCAALGASLATIRRDLNDLEGHSLLRRMRGGAVQKFHQSGARSNAKYLDAI